MDDILVINDESQVAYHAAEFALGLAQRLEKNVLLANVVHSNKIISDRVMAGNRGAFGQGETPENLKEHLDAVNNSRPGYQPAIKTLNASQMSENGLVSFINQNKIYMIMQGSANQGATVLASQVNMLSVLNRVLCPFMFIPEGVAIKPIERIMYLTDLRYCQVPVLNYLTKLDSEAGISILIAHICAKGLPDLDDTYANDLFTNEICVKANCSSLFFSHIKEKNINTTVDTMIHGMQADLLVCQNRWYHFNELLGDDMPSVIPKHISIPLLIFPS
jgi:hypothetical protein